MMNHGEVMYNDKPKNVFAHYRELEKAGLAAPQVTYIMHDLKERGIPVDIGVTTVSEAADEILRALGMETSENADVTGDGTPDADAMGGDTSDAGATGDGTSDADAAAVGRATGADTADSKNLEKKR